jgi:hypothetical protein
MNRLERISLARPQGWRGAGLGNEIFALGKARIAAQLLDGRLVEQPWWLNPRRYGPDLGRNVWQPVRSGLLSPALPVLRLGTADVATVFDYEASMRRLASQLPRNWMLVHESGMSGGYLGIRSARGFLQRRLGLATFPPATRGGLRVGIHYRAGDFSSQPLRPGVFNARLVPHWVTSAMAAVGRSWDGQVDYALHTDAPVWDPDVQAIRAGLPPGSTLTLSHGRVLDDLRSLASCDVIIPSVSSFSMLAIFLSDALYLWPREHLTETQGWLSIWGYDDQVRRGPLAAHAASMAAAHDTTTTALPRGLPLAVGDAPDLADWLLTAGAPHHRCSDLIYYGVVSASD